MDLKYGIYTGNNFAWSSGQNFRELDLKIVPETERIQGRTLRSKEYSHFISKKDVFKITISADELYNTTKYNFIKSFYAANGGRWQISLDSWASSTEVVLKEAGEMPVEFIDNVSGLPEISFTLIEK